VTHRVEEVEMKAPAKPSTLQRVIDTWKGDTVSPPDTEMDAADMGTAFGLDYSLAHQLDLDDDFDFER
jgi:hypothetical protein